MLTLFTTAKPFEGHNGMIQRNALQSWKLLDPDVEIIVFGDDAGAAEACGELGIRHEPHVEKRSGLNLISYMFVQARELARHKYLCYSNCDIVLMSDFWHMFKRTVTWREKFLLVAQRWDTDVTSPLDFRQPDWMERLREHALATGTQQHFDFIDFFVFPKDLYEFVPPFVVGRSYWDHWMVWKAKSLGAAVLDASEIVTPVHQNHNYAHHPQGKIGTHTDSMAKHNFALAGNGTHLLCIRDATHRVHRNGKIRRTVFRRPMTSPGWLKFRQVIAERTFAVRKALGLRRKNLGRLREATSKAVK